MQNVFSSTGFLDKRALKFGLTEDLLMENAAAALEVAVTNALEKRITTMLPVFCTANTLTVLIVCGSGNNGGDGYALARRIHGKKLNLTDNLKTPVTIHAAVYEAKPPKTAACILQAERAVKCGIAVYRESVQPTNSLQSTEYLQLTDFLHLKELSHSCAILVDCLFGSGLSGKPDEQSEKLIQVMNNTKQQNPAIFFLACDIPSGLTANGEAFGAVFEADETISMGALKLALFSDTAKDYTGKLTVADLGISRAQFEQNSESTNNLQIFLLQKSDLRLPIRKKQNVHKGTFGHAAVFAGEKPGAANLACQAAFTLGAGLVTAVHTNPERTPSAQWLPSEDFPPQIMHTNSLPTGETALCAGMGLGRENPAADTFFYYASKNPDIPCVIDADLLHHSKLPELLANRGNLIVTPHPKEFAALLNLCRLGSFSVPQITAHRFELATTFCAHYPNTTLLLKGANTLICANGNTYINTFGTNSLAKGGSGDILAGFIVSLLAQGYSPPEAAINASLIHALAAQTTGGTYSLTPQDLFRAVKELEFLHSQQNTYRKKHKPLDKHNTIEI